MFNNKRIGVAVPAYNEERLLKDTVDTIPQLIDRIYLVDDGSLDNTPEIINSLTDPRVCSIRHQRNRGVGAAIASAYKRALAEDMDIVVVVNGDNQMAPENIIRLIEPLAAGAADYAKGDRLSKNGHRQGMSPWRHPGNWLLTFLTRVATGNRHLHDPQNGCTAISRKALQMIELDRLYSRYGYCHDLLIKLSARGLRILDIPIPATEP